MSKSDSSIPDVNLLFDKFLAPHYSPDRRHRLRGDFERLSKPGTAALSVMRLTEEGIIEVQHRLHTMVEAARGDWSSYLDVKGDPDLSWIEAFDRHYDRTAIRKVIDSSEPGDFSNDYLVLCCELGAVLGRVMIESFNELEWVYDWPYWESFLYHPPTGYEIPVFHWAVKKMSDYGVDDGLKDKVRACLQGLRRGFDTPDGRLDR